MKLDKEELKEFNEKVLKENNKISKDAIITNDFLHLNVDTLTDEALKKIFRKYVAFVVKDNLNDNEMIIEDSKGYVFSEPDNIIVNLNNEAELLTLLILINKVDMVTGEISDLKIRFDIKYDQLVKFLEK